MSENIRLATVENKNLNRELDDYLEATEILKQKLDLRAANVMKFK